MSGPRILAIDVGTTAVKAALVVDGRTVRAGEAPMSLHHPAPGRTEQDPQEWWTATVRAVRSLGPLTDVAAVGVTGQMQDLVPLGADGTPVRPAVLYADQRATAEHHALEAELGDAWAEAVGSRPDATNVAAKWRWLQAHEPSMAAATATVLLGAHGFVVQQMTGVAGCDPTTAATSGAVRRRQRHVVGTGRRRRRHPAPGGAARHRGHRPTPRRRGHRARPARRHTGGAGQR